MYKLSTDKSKISDKSSGNPPYLLDFCLGAIYNKTIKLTKGLKMSDNTTLDIGRIMDLAVDGGLKNHLQLTDLGVGIDDTATESIKRLKSAIELLQQAEKSIKTQFLDYGSEYGVREFNSNELNVALKTAIQFDIQDGYRRMWSKIKVNYTPNNEVIEAYIRLNDTLPEGVDIKDKTPVVQFKLKEIA